MAVKVALLLKEPKQKGIVRYGYPFSLDQICQITYLFPSAKKPQHHQEKIYKIEVEAERPHDG